MSLVSWLTPWKPATSAMCPSARAARIRPGVTSMILARPCVESVITPAWEPVNERASAPRDEMAMATSALEMRSPEVSSMSSSRAGGDGETCWARSISSSVVSPIAETTTTTSWPSLRVATIRSATRLIRSAVPTDEPPYFWTTSPTATPTVACVRPCFGPVTDFTGRIIVPRPTGRSAHGREGDDGHRVEHHVGDDRRAEPPGPDGQPTQRHPGGEQAGQQDQGRTGVVDLGGVQQCEHGRGGHDGDPSAPARVGQPGPGDAATEQARQGATQSDAAEEDLLDHRPDQADRQR